MCLATYKVLEILLKKPGPDPMYCLSTQYVLHTIGFHVLNATEKPVLIEPLGVGDFFSVGKPFFPAFQDTVENKNHYHHT